MTQPVQSTTITSQDTASTSTASTGQAGGRVPPILFVLGQRDDWGLYMPQLLRLAQKNHAGIHVLETGAPLGTGNFTSNAVQNKAAPSDTPQPTDDTLAWPDTVVTSAVMNEFVDGLVDYFRKAGFKAAGDWKPDFDHAQLGEYAERIGAKIVAMPKTGFPASLIQSTNVGTLEQEGYQVVLLEEITQEEIDSLNARIESKEEK
jgi:hypothetical protein